MLRSLSTTLTATVLFALAGCHQAELVVTTDTAMETIDDRDTGQPTPEDTAGATDTDEDPGIVTRDTGGTTTTSPDTGAPDTGAPDTTVADTGPVDTGTVDTGPETGFVAPLCRSDGDYSIYVVARELDEFNGRTAWLSVSEPESIDGGSWALRVRQAGVIHDGEVSFLCDASLNGSAGFPSLAVTIDVDESGHCSGADMWMAEEFARWTADLTYIIDSRGIHDPPVGVEQRIGSWRPVSGAVYGGVLYCQFFFEEP